MHCGAWPMEGEFRNRTKVLSPLTVEWQEKKIRRTRGGQDANGREGMGRLLPPVTA